MKNFMLVNLALTMFVSVSLAIELDERSILNSINADAKVSSALAIAGKGCDKVSNLTVTSEDKSITVYAYAICGEGDVSSYQTDRLVHVYATVSADGKSAVANSVKITNIFGETVEK